MTAGEYVTTTTTELAGRIDAAHGCFADLFADVDDRCPVGPAWTAKDVLAHVVSVVNRYTAFAPDRLADSPRGVDAINEREVASLVDRSTPELLDLLDLEMRAFRAQWGPQTGLPLDLPLPFHGGASLDLQSGLTNLVAEFLLHGWDVAEASGRAWSIDERSGALICAFLTQILPSYARPTNTGRLVARFDLDGVAPWVLAVDGPAATVGHPLPGVEPDVILRGPPAPVVLFLYGRAGLAALAEQGLEVAGGARAELAPAIPGYLEEP